MGNIFSISLSCDTLIYGCSDCIVGLAPPTCQLQENLVELRTALDRLKVLRLNFNRGIIEVPVGISKLLSLQYLDLSCTRITQLPIELKALENLKCLDLRGIRNWIIIPRGLISGFSKLQILRMLYCYPFDDKVKDNNECLAEELQCLNHLSSLSVSLTSDFALNRLLSAQRLHSCVQLIGLHFFMEPKQLNNSSLANFRSLNALMLENLISLEEVKTQWKGKMLEAPTNVQIYVNPSEPCFEKLLRVRIDFCSKLTDATWLILVPHLRYVSVSNCDKLEEIINEINLGQVVELVGTLSPFAKLKKLHLFNLPALKSIYWDALPFSCMNEIDVYHCPKLRRLPLNSNSAKGNKFRIHGEEKWWKELQWEDESTPNAFLPHFIANEY